MDDIQVDTKPCTNCRQAIHIHNYEIHLVHCERRYDVCEQCNTRFLKEQLESHKESVHRMEPCNLCQESMEISKIDAHQETDCPRRLVSCSFCELEQPLDEMPQHEDACGSRTECCEECHKYVKLRDLLRHKAERCKYPPLTPPPQPLEITNPPVSTSHTRLTNLRGFELPRYVGEPPLEPWCPVTAFIPERYIRESSSPESVRPVEEFIEQAIAEFPAVSLQSFTYGAETFPTHHEDRRRVESPSQELSDFELAQKLQKEEIQQIEIDRKLAMQLAKEAERRIDSPPPLRVSVPTRGFTVRQDSKPWEPQQYFDVESREPILPCRKCGSLLIESVLVNHERNCMVREATETNFNNEIPCEFCRVPYSAEDLVYHEPNCSFNTIQPFEVRSQPSSAERVHIPSPATVSAPRTTADPSEPLIPCEFCGKLFGFSLVETHQRDCMEDSTSRGSPNPVGGFSIWNAGRY